MLMERDPLLLTQMVELIKLRHLLPADIATLAFDFIEGGLEVCLLLLQTCMFPY